MEADLTELIQGSLGIPRIGLLERIGLQPKSIKEFLFFDTSLSNCIENAFQALALDESRTSFSPSVWEKTRGNRTVRISFEIRYQSPAKSHSLQNLRQVWFPGVHSNIGGGYDDQGQANITLAWMISQLEPFLDFDPDYVLDQDEANRNYYKKVGQKPRPWSFGRYCRRPLDALSCLWLPIPRLCRLYHEGINSSIQAKSTSP